MKKNVLIIRSLVLLVGNFAFAQDQDYATTFRSINNEKLHSCQNQGGIIRRGGRSTTGEAPYQNIVAGCESATGLTLPLYSREENLQKEYQEIEDQNEKRLTIQGVECMQLGGKLKKGYRKDIYYGCESKNGKKILLTVDKENIKAEAALLQEYNQCIFYGGGIVRRYPWHDCEINTPHNFIDKALSVPYYQTPFFLLIIALIRFIYDVGKYFIQLILK